MSRGKVTTQREKPAGTARATSQPSLPGLDLSAPEHQGEDLAAPAPPAAPDLPPGYRMTELGPLPQEWKVVRLSDIADIMSGGPAPQGSVYFVNGKHPFVRVQHLDQEGLFVRRWDLVTDEAITKYGLRLFPAGTIILPKSGASIRLEKRAILPMPAYLVSHICAILPHEKAADRGFVFFALKHRRLATEKADGYPTLTLTEIKQLPVPLPPLPEQRAIAHVLWTVQQAKEATERVIAALRALKKSLMRHLFTYGPMPIGDVGATGRSPLRDTEIGPIPAHWKVVRLGEVITKAQYGLSKRGSAQGEYPILRMNNLLEGRVHASDLQFVDLSEEEFQRFRLEKGDILFNRTNSFELVGKVGIFESEGDFVFASYLIRLKCDINTVLPPYLSFYLTWEKTQSRLKALASRGVSQSNISASKLRGFPIPLPPLPEQRQIAAILQAVDRRIEAEENYARALETLFKTLLHDLMTAQRRLPPEFIVQFAGAQRRCAPSEEAQRCWALESTS